jgi:hypothetical protein
MSKVIRKRQTSAAGLFLELTGLVLLFIYPIGTFIGVGLIIAGASMAKKYVCSECGNRVDNQDVKLCPVCKVHFTD